jgi:PAS domain S-box-containing protein
MRATVAIPDAASFDPPEPMIAGLSARDALAEEAQRIAGVGTWHYDYTSDVVSWSKELYRIFGVSQDRFHPTFESFLQCVHPDDREAMLAADRSASSGKPMSFEHRIVRPDGEVRHVHEQAQIVIRNELGGHQILVGTTQDITERKKAEETVAAQEAKMREMRAKMHFLARQGAMATMAATLAHEINQPLLAISNYATGLRRTVEGLGTDSPISMGLAQIESNALRAGEIIRRLRSTAERRALKTEPIDLDRLVGEAVEFSTFGCEGVTFKFEGQAAGIVLADHIQIAQVLTNFIMNACEAMEQSEPKIITISMVEDAQRVTVCVSDTGPGVPPDVRLFEAIASGKEHGMGIGLSICRTIIESYGGRIWAEQPAQGARFCFSLPRADAGAP